MVGSAGQGTTINGNQEVDLAVFVKGTNIYGVAKRIPREGGQIADIKHASVSDGIYLPP